MKPALGMVFHKHTHLFIQNEDRETAMHLAVEQKEGQPVIVASVLSSFSADHSICNGENFNVLHWAVLKNNSA